MTGNSYNMTNTPQYQYARLAPSQRLSEHAKSPFNTMKNLMHGVNQKKITDYELSYAKNPLAVGGGLILATLATLGGVKKTLGVGHLAGFAAWMAALVYGPKVANSIVQLKTGINLNQEYINTYNERYGLFKDPQYMPLHLLPEEELNRIGDRLNIPYGVDRKRLIEDKIRQISVQTGTWWNLVAGAAVPVVALGFTNTAFGSLMGVISSIKALYHEKIGLFRTSSPEQVSRHLDAYIEEKLGDGANSWISRWKKNLENKVVSSLELNKLFKIQDVINMPEEKMVVQLVEHLSKLSDVPEKRQTLDSILYHLERERQAIEGLEHDILDTLQRCKETLRGLENGEAELRYFEQGKGERARILLSREQGNALSGIQHYEMLFKNLQKKPLNSSEIRTLLEKPGGGEFNHLMRLGQIDEAKKLTGSTQFFREIRLLLHNKNTGRSSELLGDSPRTHLLRSIKNVSSKKIWRQRMIAYTGGGILLATILFDMLFVGLPFKASSREARS